MSTAGEATKETHQKSTQNAPNIDILAESLQKSGLQGDSEDTQAVAQAEPPDFRPRIVYTRKQLVLLSQSPLVKPPDGMPEFKAWFGLVFALLALLSFPSSSSLPVQRIE